MTSQDIKVRIVEERDLLRKALFNEWKAAQKVYEAREALKRIEDTIIGEIADNGLYKNEKQRTEAKRMARINDGRYIAGLKAIADAEIERFNFQASIIDSQTRIMVFTSDYEFALLGRRDAQFQFALTLAKVVQADTSIAIEVTAPKLGSNLTDKTVDGSQTANTDKTLTGIPDGYQINADLIHAFIDTQEGRMVIGDWLRAHGKPVMAQAFETGISDAERVITESLPVTRVDDAPGKYVDDVTTQILSANDAQTAAQLKLGCPPNVMAAHPGALTENRKKDIVIGLHTDDGSAEQTEESKRGEDSPEFIAAIGGPAPDVDLPEGVELKAGIPVCSSCGMMLHIIQPGLSHHYPNAIDGLYVHPENAACASVDSSHPDAKLSRSEGAKGQRIGGVDV